MKCELCGQDWNVSALKTVRRGYLCPVCTDRMRRGESRGAEKKASERGRETGNHDD